MDKVIVKSLLESNSDEALRFLSEEAANIKTRIIRENNDKRYASLDLLEAFAFRVPPKALEIMKLFADERNEQLPTKYTKPFPREGWEHRYILDKCLDILRQKSLSYNAIEEWLSTMIGFYNYKIENKKYADIRKKARDILVDVADLDAQIVFRSTPEGQPRLVNYSFQESVFNAIKKRISSKDNRIYSLLLDMVGKLFDSEIEGDYWDRKSLQIKIWPLICNRQITGLRNNMLDLLFNLFIKEKDVFRKIFLISTLNNAMQSPTRGKHGCELEDLITRNLIRIIDFYNNLAFAKTNPAVLLEIEKQIVFKKRRYEKDKNEKNKLGATAYKKVTNLLKKLRRSRIYKLYRIVVGDDFYFYDDENSLTKVREERAKSLECIVNAVNSDNVKKWADNFITIISTYSYRQEYEFRALRTLLNKLGHMKPNVASEMVRYFSKHIVVSKNFLTDIVIGIRSSNNVLANKIINKWLCSKDYNFIAEIPYSYWGAAAKIADNRDVALLEKVFNLRLTGSQRKDLDLRFLRIIRFVYKKSPKIFDKMLFRIFNRLEKKELSLFSNEIMLANHTKEIEVDKWKISTFEQIMKKYEEMDRLDYHDEEILSMYCIQKPLRVIDFFKKRVKMRQKKRNSLKFDPIPFHLNELAKTIRTHRDYEKVIMKIIGEWIMSGNWMLKNEGKQLLHSLSSSIDNILRDVLLKLIKTKKIANILAAIEVLDAYHGSDAIYEMCLEAVAKSKGNKRVGMATARALYQVGGVFGEYGLSEEYKKRLKRIKLWKKNKNKHVSSFAKKFAKNLQLEIDREESRVKEELLIREMGLER